MILTTSLFTLMIHTELNLLTLKMCILQALKHSVKKTTASIGSVSSLNSPQYRFLDHFHMTGCICVLRITGKTLFHFGKVHIKGWMKAWRSTGSLIMSGLWSVRRQLLLQTPSQHHLDKELQTFILRLMSSQRKIGHFGLSTSLLCFSKDTFNAWSIINISWSSIWSSNEPLNTHLLSRNWSISRTIL